MSKRVSNKKGSQRKRPARSRVRYGWRRLAEERAARYRALVEAGVVTEYEQS